MKFSAIAVAIGLFAACVVQPNLDHRDAHAAVMPFHSESLAQMQVASSDNETNLQHMFEHVAIGQTGVPSLIDGPSGNVRYRIA